MNMGMSSKIYPSLPLKAPRMPEVLGTVYICELGWLSDAAMEINTLKAVRWRHPNKRKNSNGAEREK